MEEKITVAEETVPPPKAEAAVAAKPQTERDSWKPKTSIGRKVKEGLIKDIDSILDKDMRVLESEIVDILMPDLSTDLLMVGQSKGKFGGGQKRVFRQTQKKTQEGNKPKFATIAVAGNQDGYVGIGYGKSKETVPAREKSIRNAKLSIIKIRRGCGEQTSAKINLFYACFGALQKLMDVKVSPKDAEELGIVEGRAKK
ncbi:hypothetical protein HYX09_03735 [Candidatus Woesearchaeota archaeon]|nr:hypothetical protein [Candidatus Woesearchaeota archaeon]